jgi:hypothetical protein
VSLATFAGVKAAVADWLERTDLTAQILDFFALAQAKMYVGDKSLGMQEVVPLRISQMVATGTLTPNASGVVSITSGVAANWLAFIEVTPTFTGAQALNYRSPWMLKKQPELLVTGAGHALSYTVEGDSLITAPPSAQTLTAAWYQKFTPLVADGDTDWVLTNAPQVYLNGCLAEACAYLEDDRLVQFRGMFAGAIQALNVNDEMSRASGGVPIARPRGVA